MRVTVKTLIKSEVKSKILESSEHEGRGHDNYRNVVKARVGEKLSKKILDQFPIKEINTPEGTEYSISLKVMESDQYSSIIDLLYKLADGDKTWTKEIERVMKSTTPYQQLFNNIKS